MVKRFHYLKYALSLVLIYVGAKIFVQQFIGKIPPVFSLTVTFGLLAGGILFSLWVTRNGTTRLAEHARTKTHEAG
jgi:tellurite resistance protein TerC